MPAEFPSSGAVSDAAVLAKIELVRLLLAGTLLVESSGPPLVTAATYTGGLMATYTEQRESDAKTRTVTITRNGDGTIASQAASAWA